MNLAADSKESTEEKFRDALFVYERLRDLVDETADLLGATERASQENRLRILCWKFKAWLDYRLYILKKKLSVE